MGGRPCKSRRPSAMHARAEGPLESDWRARLLVLGRERASGRVRRRGREERKKGRGSGQENA
eukprot:2818053-Pleurochrysis_carterae.AAC.2